MKKLKHTPGLWTVESDGTTVAMNGQCVITAPAPDGATLEEQRANARLIAAARELLTALTWITRCARAAGPSGTTMYFISDEAMADAHAAIAKAGGGRASTATSERVLYACPDCGSAAAAPAGVVCRVCKRGIIERKGR